MNSLLCFADYRLPTTATYRA